jgi:hypothetical protein
LRANGRSVINFGFEAPDSSNFPHILQRVV